MFRRREEAKRTKLLAVRVSEEELSAIDWLASVLEKRDGEKRLATDIVREALADFHRRVSARSEPPPAA